MFKPKLPQQEQGFTLVEVLVAILITSLFVAVAMDAMVLAAVFKTRAQKYAEATTWIQADLENVKSKAANLQYTSTRCKGSVLTTDAAKGASSINVAFANNFAVNDNLKVGSDSGTYTISVITGNTLTITPTLQTQQLAAAVVVVATPTAGFADYLLQNLPTSVDTTQPPIIIDGISYNPIKNTPSLPNPKPVGYPNQKPGSASKLWLLRNASDSPNAPYNTLQLYYAVVPDVNGFPSKSPVATLYTEVIPNAALQCQ